MEIFLEFDSHSFPKLRTGFIKPNHLLFCFMRVLLGPQPRHASPKSWVMSGERIWNMDTHACETASHGLSWVLGEAWLATPGAEGACGWSSGGSMLPGASGMP